MIDRNLQKLKYETSVHHKQNLRSHIDQDMIDRIEISPHPSLNYQKAYQSLYQDELQKSMMLHDQKKAVDQTKKTYDTLVAGQHLKIYKSDEPFKNSISAINVPNLNYRDVGYLNYDLLKDTKALDHTLKNYDGGQGFYKNSDLHQLKQREELDKMRATLQKQISLKQLQKNREWEKKKQEEFALRNREEVQKNYQSQVMQTEMGEKSRHRDVIMNQMHEERVKRGRRSIFNYNNVSRHNPITNPIEYHIDNPYILKQIQGSSQNSAFNTGNYYGR